MYRYRSYIWLFLIALSAQLFILNNQNVGVMRRGRVWVRLAADAAPKYGDPVHLLNSGDDVGCFSTTGGLTVPGRFIGPAAAAE